MVEQATVEKLTNKIMADFISGIMRRFDAINEYKENRSSYTSSMGNLSEKYQKFCEDIIVKNIAGHLGGDAQAAKDKFAEISKECVTFKYINKNVPEKNEEFLALRKQLRTTTDEGRKKQLSQEIKQWQEGVFVTIPEESKKEFYDEFINEKVSNVYAGHKMRSDVNNQLASYEEYDTQRIFAENEGYCLKALTSELYNIDHHHHCLDFLPQSVDKALRPRYFVPEMMSGEQTKKHTYATDSKQTFREIIENNNIQAGALIVINNNDQPQHAMLYTGKKNEKGEPLLIGFNSGGKKEEIDIEASFAKNGAAREGTVIDISALVHDSVEKVEDKEKLLASLNTPSKMVSKVGQHIAGLRKNISERTGGVLVEGNRPQNSTANQDILQRHLAANQSCRE